MDIKRWSLATLAAFVVLFALEFFVNDVLLKDLYVQTAALWRPAPEMERMIWMFWLAYAISAAVFTLIYAQGYEKLKAGAAQGARYGLYMGVFLAANFCLTLYTVLPIPGVLAVYWFLAGVTEYVMMGATVGWIYRKK